jgi:hypothetical protein
MAISLTQGQAANNGDAPHLHALPLGRRRKQGNDRGLPQERRIFAAIPHPLAAVRYFARKSPTVRAPVLLAFPSAIV